MIPDNSDQAPVLILGGAGKTGRRVMERLTARGRAVPFGSHSRSAPPCDWDDRSKAFTSALSAQGVPLEAEYAREMAVTSVWDVPALAGV